MAKTRAATHKRAQALPFGILAGLLIGIALILLSVFLFTTQTARVDSKAAALQVSLETLNGGAMKLSDLRGKYVMVNLWATWCPPCRAELPDLIRFYDAHKSDGLEFVAINTQDQRTAAETYVREHNMNFTVPFDPQGQVLYAWTDGALPDTFLLDPEGRIVFQWTGQIPPAILEQRIAPLLKP
jgi:thiol-disulfide isomerase/thioredoxin